MSLLLLIPTWTCSCSCLLPPNTFCSFPPTSSCYCSFPAEVFMFMPVAEYTRSSFEQVQDHHARSRSLPGPGKRVPADSRRTCICLFPLPGTCFCSPLGNLFMFMLTLTNTFVLDPSERVYFHVRCRVHISSFKFVILVWSLLDPCLVLANGFLFMLNPSERNYAYCRRTYPCSYWFPGNRSVFMLIAGEIVPALSRQTYSNSVPRYRVPGATY